MEIIVKRQKKKSRWDLGTIWDGVKGFGGC